MEKLLRYIMLQVKRFRAAVWKKFKGNNDSLGLNVMEYKAIMWKGGKGKNQSVQLWSSFMKNSVVPALLYPP